MAEIQKYSRKQLLSSFPRENNVVLVDLGCGKRKKKGYIGVDSLRAEGVDIACDLAAGLPFENDVVDGISSTFFFEHMPDIVFLFQEVYRSCKDGAIVEFSVPYYQSVTQYKDPTHKAVIVPDMIRYFGKEDWYGSDYNIGTNFKLLKVRYHYMMPFSLLASKKLFVLWPLTYPVLLCARRFLWNVVHSVTMKLQVIK